MSCGRTKAMGKQIDKIKQQMQLTGPEILAQLIYSRAIKSKDRIFKQPYFGYPCYIEYCHEHQDEGFQLDCLYLGQEQSYMLVQPDYKSALAVAPQILEWLDAVYATCCPPEPPRAKGGRGNRVSNRQQIANSVLDMRGKNDQRRTPKKHPLHGSKNNM